MCRYMGQIKGGGIKRGGKNRRVIGVLCMVFFSIPFGGELWGLLFVVRRALFLALFPRYIPIHRVILLMIWFSSFWAFKWSLF